MELLKMGFKLTNYRWYVCLVWKKLAPWNMAPENGGSSLGFGLFSEAMWVLGMVTYPQGKFQGPPMWDRYPCWHHPSSMGMIVGSGHVKGVPLLGGCGEIPWYPFPKRLWVDVPNFQLGGICDRFTGGIISIWSLANWQMDANRWMPKTYTTPLKGFVNDMFFFNA